MTDIDSADFVALTSGSKLEARLGSQLLARDVPGFCREYQFDSDRKWRFDFAWPGRMLAVEVEGGTWSKGRHVRGGGFAADCRKYNRAIELGWRVIRGDASMVKSGELADTAERMLR